MNMHVPALQRSLPDVVAEYDLKFADIDAAIERFERAGFDAKNASQVGGTVTAISLDVGHLHRRTMQDSLLRSAWMHVYKGLNIELIATARDRKLFEQSMEKPAPFTLENIKATFGRYILDPRGNILRGLAETFCALDQAYRSHEKMKIGVSGLPKRIVLSNVAGYGSWGRERLVDVLNALASYRGEPLIEHGDMKPVDDLHSYFKPSAGQAVIRGLTIKKFMNGNAHLMFNQAALRDINRALAEYYGDVLADCPEERPAKQTSTEVSKDLAFYPTPQSAIEWTMGQISRRHGSDALRNKKTLEPSCGDGRFMIELQRKGAHVVGFEVDVGRAGQCRQKGLRVSCVNFLATAPCGTYDAVVMNPPFAGRHYEKHVRHAYAFLKPGGHLFAILPATAVDHGLLDDVGVRSRWSDSPWEHLPVGSFSESGTNINTVLFSVTKGA